MENNNDYQKILDAVKIVAKLEEVRNIAEKKFKTAAEGVLKLPTKSYGNYVCQAAIDISEAQNVYRMMNYILEQPDRAALDTPDDLYSRLRGLV